MGTRTQRRGGSALAIEETAERIANQNVSNQDGMWPSYARWPSPSLCECLHGGCACRLGAWTLKPQALGQRKRKKGRLQSFEVPPARETSCAKPKCHPRRANRKPRTPNSQEAKCGFPCRLLEALSKRRHNLCLESGSETRSSWNRVLFAKAGGGETTQPTVGWDRERVFPHED